MSRSTIQTDNSSPALAAYRRGNFGNLLACVLGLVNLLRGGRKMMFTKLHTEKAVLHFVLVPI
jgi:hypothetical protein